MEYNKNNTSRRPKEVSDLHFQSEWDRIFGKKEEKIDISRTTGIHESKCIVGDKIGE